MGKIIAISNQKGGTGKTTTVLNLGAALARFHKRKVLMVDLDPQGSLTIYTGLLPEQLKQHVGRVLQQPDQFIKAVTDYYVPGLQLLPSHPSLEEVTKSRKSQQDWKKNLTALFKLAAKKFDYVLIDCPPTLGEITHQAFCNTDSLIIPLQCEYMALRGVQLLLNTIEKSRAECNPGLQIMGILPTMFDRRTLHSREVLEEIQSALEGRVKVFSTVVYKSVRFPESAVSLLPVFEYDPKNPGAIAYKKLAKEVLDNG